MKIYPSLLFFFLLSLRLQAQEIFEDLIYEPGVINYDGVHNNEITSMAERAFVAIKNYHAKTAQESFDSILVTDKNNVLARYGLAYCKFADGDYENTIELLNPIINLNTKNAGLYSLRGRTYMVLENLSGAIDDFKKAKEYGANELDILSLSECLFYSGDFNLSAMEADNYIAKQAQRYEGYFVKGLAKAGLKAYPEAIAELEKASDLSSKNSMLFTQIGKVYIEMQDLNKAVKSISKAIKLDNENSEAYDIRASLKYDLHDYTNSIFDCNRVIELGDASAKTYITRGKSNLKLGLKKEACADFKKGQSMGNKDADELIVKSCN